MFKSIFATNPREEKRQKEENELTISVNYEEGIEFNVENENGTQIINVGQTGCGKTYNAFIIANQFPAGLFFDPQGRAKQKLQEQKIRKEWQVYSIGKRKGYKEFSINVADIDSRFANNFYVKMTPRIKKQRIFLKKFFSQPKQKKNYSTFQKQCEKKFPEIWSDLQPVLNPNDKGIPFKQLNAQKTLLDISQISVQSMIPGLLIESLIGKRLIQELPQTHFLFAIDEAQKYTNKNYLTGNAFANAVTRGRIFNVSTMTIGTNIGPINTDIKNNVKIFLIGKITWDAKKFSDFGFSIHPQMFEELDLSHDGECFFVNLTEKKPTPTKCVPNLSYKELLLSQQKEKQKDTIVHTRVSDYF